MSNLGTGFLLMGVGMVTVFLILLIVIYGSQWLISIINRIAPEEGRPVRSSSGGSAGAVPPEVRAVLEACVSEVTSGKGRITKITIQ